LLNAGKVAKIRDESEVGKLGAATVVMPCTVALTKQL